MKKMVIFDLDGTLLDTSEGIIKCHQHAHFYMGRTPPDISVLQQVIGGPLLQTYIQKFSFSPDEARQAVDAYRIRYAEKGIHEATLYPGVSELLFNLKEDGVTLMVATLKREDFAKTMLAEFGIAKYFTHIFGVDGKDKKEKETLLRQCVEQTGVTVKDSVLVGDSFFDYDGARACHMDFVGVTYGFGFHRQEELPRLFCENTQQVYDTIQKL